MGPPNDTRSSPLLAGGSPPLARWWGEGGCAPECLTRFCSAWGLFRSATQLSSRCALLFYRALCANLHVFLLFGGFHHFSQPLCSVLRAFFMLLLAWLAFGRSCALSCSLFRNLARCGLLWHALGLRRSLLVGFARSCLFRVDCCRSRAHLQAFVLSWAISLYPGRPCWLLLAVATLARFFVDLCRFELLSHAVGRSRSVLGALACSYLLLLALVCFLLIFFI